MIQDRRSLPPADHKSSASLNENGCRFLLADLRSAEDQLICDTFLVILLVILCTGIPCRQLRRNAIRDSLARNSFVTLYATGVRGLARPCSCGKFGLKIRRGQLHGGSIPPPGTKSLRKRRIFGCVFLCQGASMVPHVISPGAYSRQIQAIGRTVCSHRNPCCSNSVYIMTSTWSSLTRICIKDAPLVLVAT
jgi:hypothetical protein